MKHEKIIKRRDGSRVKIAVTLYTCSHRVEFNWSYFSLYCQPGKRTFTTVVPEAATPEEIHSAKFELWQKIKPTL